VTIRISVRKPTKSPDDLLRETAQLIADLVEEGGWDHLSIEDEERALNGSPATYREVFQIRRITGVKSLKP
jgi:hypothetical protein